MPSYDAVLVLLRERIDYARFFSEFLDLQGSGAEREARCIFHDDGRASMSVNVVEGLYCCHVPDCGARGDFIDFFRRVRSLTFREAIEELCRREGLDAQTDAPPEGAAGGADRTDALTARSEALLARFTPGARAPRGGEPRPRGSASPNPREERSIDPAVVETLHRRLLETPAKLTYLAERRGLTEQTVRDYRLGFDGQRFTIPVLDELGQVYRNIRRYLPEAPRSEDKMLSWRTGYGQARLYPIHLLPEDVAVPVYLFEGEMDCLLARQLGLAAVTATGGAGTWREDFDRAFAGRAVTICYDNDNSGRVGSQRVAARLVHVAREVRLVTIPLAEPPGADFTDYVVGHGHTVADFLELVAQGRLVLAEEAESPPPIEREAELVHLSQASQAAYYNLPVRFHVMVSGKTTAPYLVPQEVRVGCPAALRGTLPFCERCPVMQEAGAVTRRIDYEGNEVLKVVDVPQEKLDKAVKAAVGVPAKCPVARYDVTEALNIEKVQLIPEVARTEEQAPYVTREAFFLGHALEANRSYLMSGTTVPEPKKQLATHVIHTAIESQSNIDAFRLTADVVGRLARFRPPQAQPTAQDLWRHLGVVYDDLEKTTRIYQRRDLMLAVDLVMHSVLTFGFQGERLVRGWCEALIIGDSRTGKTTIARRLLEHYGAGEFTTGENTTLAGLVGGLHQIGTSWVLQWGRYPLNDRRLLVIDEAGNLPQEQIARMSSMRSSGIAEVIKVHTERTNARTRGIWISNPRSNRTLTSYSQGVLAVRELIGAPEDVARFDLVATAASADVPTAVINAERHAEQAEVYTADLCHQRVMWAWSRTAEQVVWQAGAEARVLELATEQGERYRHATEIPLVEPNEQRIKLARLAVATAALFFSSAPDGQQVWVTPAHVDFAAQFLETLYAKPSLAFREYAEQQRDRYVLRGESAVADILSRQPRAKAALMEQELFNLRDLQEILGIDDREDLRQAITRLKDNGFLRKAGVSNYAKTPAAIRWLRAQLSGTDEAAQTFAALAGTRVPEEPEW